MLQSTQCGSCTEGVGAGELPSACAFRNRQVFIESNISAIAAVKLVLSRFGTTASNISPAVDYCHGALA